VGPRGKVDEAGLPVPEDVYVVGYDNTYLAELALVSLTRRPPPARAGRVRTYETSPRGAQAAPDPALLMSARASVEISITVTSNIERLIRLLPFPERGGSRHPRRVI
jgi:hypothetical protein